MDAVSVFIVRDEQTGKVIMTEQDMISRYAGMITVPVNFTGTIEFESDAFLTGEPYYIYDANGNIHGSNVSIPNNTIGALFYVTCEFNGNKAKATIAPVTWANQGKYQSYIYFGVF